MATLGDAPETGEKLVARLAEGRVVGHGTEALVEPVRYLTRCSRPHRSSV
jgi:hypothetical protein